MSTPHPSSPPKPNPKITLHPVHALDFPLLATLETQTFYPEPFSSVAFGPTRDSAENMALRAEGLTKNYLEGSEEMGGRVGEKRRWWSFVKAVCGEEIVGWAGWSFNFVGEGEGEGEVGEKEEKEEGGEGKASRDSKDEIVWGIGANAKFCHDVFIAADEHMLRSCGGKDFAKLTTLVISPSYQRQGIGTLLLEEGLKEIDELGLQCVLSSSPQGEGLYRRFGFEEVEVMELRLWEYEGGEGLGATRHVVMRRPQAVSR